ncbi:MAG: VTT domain-containing protein [Clostridia bacterium]|nr:VTT domain-containing protein [Clostridia bacterium]
MENKKKPKKLLLFSGLILLALSLAVGILLFSLQFEELWRWYAQAKRQLAELEQFITHIDKAWQFIGAILLLFAIKSFFPIYPTSTVCFLTGVVLPMHLAVPVNIIGFAVLLTVRYFWGRRFGAGNAWKIISKTDTLRKLIQQDGKGNPALLIALRLIPGMPINSISGIYGSFDFGYGKFILLSTIGFLPKLISFTFVGRNVYDPLSSGFLLPIMLLLFFTGISALSVNGVWTTVEKIIEYSKKRKNIKSEKKGLAEND